MKKQLLVIAFILSTLFASAQESIRQGATYKTAIGYKFYPSGITLKIFGKKRRAGELIGYFREEGFRLTALHEWHMILSSSGALKAYAGFGGHAAFYKGSSSFGSKSYFGADAVLGLDYKFPKYPINISADFQPSYEFDSGQDFQGWGGVAIRFAF